MIRSDIFMTYDIRGKNISTHEAFIIGRAIGSFFNGSCFVSFDCREDSSIISEHLIEGLRSSGINVTLSGLMTSPAAYFKTMNNFDFGVFITASHNPPGYNGFKIILRDGSSIDPSDLVKIKELALNHDFNNEESVLVNQDITALNDYCHFLERTFGKQDVKCVFDCFNGSSGVLVNKVFKRLLNAITINDVPLGDFGGKQPEPKESNLKSLQERVLELNASFGVGLDGDGDRSVFVDDKGRVIDGNKMTMLFAKHILKSNKGVIVAPVSVSSLLESEIVKPLGGSVVWCPVGHTFIEKELIKHNGLFGGEFSSHFYWNQFFPYSDGAFSSLMLAKIINESGKLFSELIDELPTVFVVKGEVEFESHERKSKVASELINKLLIKHPDALTMDGIKFIDGETTVLLRQSLTRPTVKVFIESKDKDLANNKLRTYVKLINNYKN